MYIIYFIIMAFCRQFAGNGVYGILHSPALRFVHHAKSFNVAGEWLRKYFLASRITDSSCEGSFADGSRTYAFRKYHKIANH